MDQAPTSNPLSPDSLAAHHSLIEHSPVPMAELEGDGHIFRYVNPAFCRLVGRSKEALLGNAFAATAQEADTCVTALDRVYRTGEAETHTQPGRPEPHPPYWSYAMWRLVGTDKQPMGVMMQVTETTRFHHQAGAVNEALLISSVRQHELTEVAEKLNEQLQGEIADRRIADHALRESEERYRTLFDMAPVAVYCCDTSGVILKFNRRATELWGREPALGETDQRFCGSYKMFLPDGSFVPHDQCAMAEVLSGEITKMHDGEVLIERPDGSRVTVIVNIHPLKDERDQIIGAINCFYDITERKQHEEHQEMLRDELSHRVKNTLATVQSIARQTMHGSLTMAAFREGFDARLDALSKTHDILMQNVSQVAALRDLVAGELLHYAADDASRYVIDGDHVSLGSRRAVAIGMLFHELATNAAKYGALSTSSGRVKVSWTVDHSAAEPSLRLRWVEAGGPRVEKPSRRGFGSRLIERGLAHELGADVHLIFDPAGVRCSMDIPLDPAAETA